MENMSPVQEKFSVSMCVYGGDRPDWFQTAVDSVIQQTKTPDEIVLVVDGPVPGELDAVIRHYEALPFFRVIRLPENQGHGNARRVGLSQCSHELVALMDADDISLPGRFETQLSYFASDPQLAAMGGTITEFVGEPENLVGKRVVPLEDAAIKAEMKRRCPMNQMTVMFRRSLVEQAGGYLDWFCEEDYYLWVRMCLEGQKFANCRDVLVNVRVGKEMYQRRGGWKYFASEARFQKLLLDKGLIGAGTFLINTAKRFVVQVMLPVGLRSFVFQKFAREAADAPSSADLGTSDD